MITREEYNKALDIVEAYQKKLFMAIDGIRYAYVDVNLRDNEKTLIGDWDKNDECSIRLSNILRPHEYSPTKKDLPKYIEDFTKKGFLRLRNAGHASWKEFTTLRGY